ncbi:MAG: hypothetical protein J7L53_12240 [Deltaproteobacteria bacterium]|nr:hypothetical protein [Deltaproteobacteria bacterium]
MDIEKIKKMIDIYPEKGRLPCPVAHYIAVYLSIPPIEVGRVATKLGIGIYQCQLGLFGYGRKGISSYKVIGKKVEVPEKFKAIVEKKAMRQGGKAKISCIQLWQIADELGINRFEAGNAADAFGYKITPCQLGCF